VVAVRLSVLDIGWPGHIPDLVPLLDAAGYHRYWTTEHYSPVQSGSPVVAAAVAASQSGAERIRVGTAGVLLHFRSPASVAADFALLELLFAGRVDLGIAASSAGGGMLADALLDGRPLPVRAQHDERVAEVARLVERRDGAEGFGPRAPGHAEVWVCGTSAASAAAAARLGLSYAFHHGLKDPDVDGPAIVRSYVDAFRAVGTLEQPQWNVAAFGICAASERRARRLAGERPLAYVGRPDQCAVQVAELAETYDTDEIVTFAPASDARDQFFSYAALAEAVGLVNSR
jgi:alkanesulfonate monooxygenase SsuD/methylene tetrahydromethanopterin reductase-like flavin-dependent oxidoreductase (luciferase family)